MSNRCSCRVENQSHICRNKMSFLINDKRICYIHAKSRYTNYALLIQKFWRGHKCRNTLTNIYYKLPDELQSKIIFYVRESYLLEKHHYSIIRNIITNKVDENYINGLLQLLLVTPHLVLLNEFNRLAHIYYLYNKYSAITPLHKISFLKNKIFNLKYFNRDNFNNFGSIDSIQYENAIDMLHINIINFQRIYYQSEWSPFGVAY